MDKTRETIEKSLAAGILTVDMISDGFKREAFGTENPGFCIVCGVEHGECEPDARNYPCDSCGTLTVFGAAELLMYVVA